MLKPTKPKPSAPRSVRLVDDDWAMLKSLMNWHGRAWFIKLIHREHRKLEAK